jgi:hypothetical protein
MDVFLVNVGNCMRVDLTFNALQKEKHALEVTIMYLDAQKHQLRGAKRR